MFATKMTGFYKNDDCPSSQELLAFQTGDLDRSQASDVRRHLHICEFCDAEVEFYSHYPQGDLTMETPETNEIPAPLYELAEALLKHHHADASSLNSLLKEKKGLVIDKA